MVTFIRRLILRYRNRHDPAVRVTGYRYRYEGSDEALGNAARHRIRQHDRDRMKLADARTQPQKPKVREFRKMGGDR